MEKSEQPLASIIIRARNEAQALKRLLPILTGQKADFVYEIWVLDNESEDETAQIARSYSAQVYTIPRHSFNYATALNLGAQLAQGSIMVNLSAHCFPQNEHWLARLIEPLQHNHDMVATYGRQLFDPQLSPYAAEGNDYYFPPTPQQLKIVAFSNANAAIRKAVLLQHPFNPLVKIFEDHLFFLELSASAPFEYVPEAVVYHEQNDLALGYLLKRWWLEGWGLYFILKHRGFPSPFKPQRFFRLRTLKGYALLAGKLYLAGRRKVGLVTFPLFLTREIIWTLGWLYGRLTYGSTARQDRDSLYRLVSQSRQAITNHHPRPAFIENHTDEDINHWPEEWQLKADWPYIRQNIADFIRRCHDSGDIFQNPVLEIGASGQNDYLQEKYEFITSNLVDNRQGAELALDMEEMSCFGDNSIGSILCSEVVEHVKHPDRALAEAFRILRPGGKLVLTTPYAIIIHNKPEDGGFHGRNFTPQGLELCLLEAGFKIHLSETRGFTLTRRMLLPSNIFVIAEKPQ